MHEVRFLKSEGLNRRLLPRERLTTRRRELIIAVHAGPDPCRINAATQATTF
jgi:hypothetical protein